MRISRIYVEAPLAPDQEVRLDGQTGHYIMRVLRLRAGDPLVLFNGDGNDYAAELCSNRRDRVQLKVSARLPAVAESPVRVSLVQAIGKGDRMDLSLQKATELGIHRIQPLFTDRTEVRLKEQKLEKRLAHWRRVVIAACEQSGRAKVPAVDAPLTFHEWLAKDSDGLRLALVPGAKDSLTVLDRREKSLELLIGPEGGLSELELKQLQLAGVQPVSLGPRVLRTETAGPAALAVLQAMIGDF